MTEINSMTTITLTTVSIKRHTKNDLAALGHKGSTFDEIIQNLLQEWRKTH